jgi:hypothetical protein
VGRGLEEATAEIDVTPLVDDGLGNSAYLADLDGIRAAVWVVAALTSVSGAVVAMRMYETHQRPPGASGAARALGAGRWALGAGRAILPVLRGEPRS